MNTLQAALWRRIDEYAFDAIDSTLTFCARLAHDNAWSPAFAQRALQEYKKFILLAMTAGHPVTPSDEVDQVWHLHLLYTRSYWGDFCSLLGGPLHHGPTQGGADERKKFNDWYGNTLQSYTQVFNVAPPSDIWPEPARRFVEAAHCKRINTRACWVIPKPRLSVSLISVAAAAPLVWLSGCTSAGDKGLPWIILGIFILFLMGHIATFETDDARTNKKKERHKNNGGGGGSGYNYGGSSDSEEGGGGGCGGGCGGG